MMTSWACAAPPKAEVAHTMAAANNAAVSLPMCRIPYFRRPERKERLSSRRSRVKAACMVREGTVHPQDGPDTKPSSPTFGSLALSLKDEIHELLTEIRACTYVVGPDIGLIQVLESEDVAVKQLRYDAAEEKAEFIQACPGALHSRVGERQVNVDTVDAMQAKFP